MIRKIIILMTGAFIMFGSQTSLNAGESVRKPAVAGKFYPGNADALRKEVMNHLAGGSSFPTAVRMVIAPHAGFIFSGPVAGKAYATLDKSTQTVILIGPSHHAWFDGLAVPKEQAFSTPLGTVSIDQERIKKLLASPSVRINSEAQGPEHSLEVQLPFLQVKLSPFKIVPVLTGNITPEKAADLIYPLIDDKTVVIASTDLSHYLPQEQARATDNKSIATILSGNAKGFLDACGESPIRIVMVLAKKMGLSPTALDARTSYETCPQYGASDKVVGYASIVYSDKSDTNAAASAGTEKALKNAAHGAFSKEDERFLLQLARQSLEAAVKGEKAPHPEHAPQISKEERGCFVTLTINNNLRGCIGYIEPIKPLYQAVIDNAKNASLNDPRFSRVTPNELSQIKVEVSVLTKPEPLAYKDPQDLLNKLVPSVDGIILQKGLRHSTYLPQVWDHFEGDKIQFLENLSLKAGMPPDGWKTADVKRYRAHHFSE